VIAFAMVFVVQWFFNRSKTGFELLMVGQNGEAARTAGINAKRTTIITLCLAGAFCGLAGMLELTASTTSCPQTSAVPTVLMRSPWPCSDATGRGASFSGRSSSAPCTPAAKLCRRSRHQHPVLLAQVIQAVVVFCVATPALIVEIFRLTDNGRFRSTGSAGGWTK